MTPQLFLSLFALLLLVGAGAVFTWRYVEYRGKRIVVCPETEKPVGVELDAWRAARTRGVDGESDLRLQSCTRWPEKKDCGQECVAQISSGPDVTLLRNIVAGWYRTRRCVFCMNPIGEVKWHDAMPGLRAFDGTLRQWSSITAEDVLNALANHAAVCFNCFNGESFRKEHPELVTDRADTPLRDRLYH
jgi:hypothetical protein